MPVVRCLIACMTWCCLAIPALAASDEPARVTIATTRDPVDKSYRKMIAGMDRFERLHALAPQATLRFQLLPRLSTTAISMSRASA